MKQVALALVVSAGCATVSVQTAGSPAEAGASIRTVAVAPLVNRTAGDKSGQVVRSMIMRALERQEGLTVVEIPPDIIIDPAKLDRTRAQEIAVKMEVDAIVTGTVFSYGYTTATPTGASSPLVRIDLRVIAATTGAIIWVASASGERPLVLTYDSVPVTELTDELVLAMAQELRDNL
jgi:hypothetical protein